MRRNFRISALAFVFVCAAPFLFDVLAGVNGEEIDPITHRDNAISKKLFPNLAKEHRQKPHHLCSFTEKIVSVPGDVNFTRILPEQLKPLPKEIAIDLGNDEKLELVLIDPLAQPDKGVFMMGSSKEALKLVKEKYNRGHNDEDEHEVELTKPYYLGKYAVTRGQFAAFVKSTEYVTEAEKGDGGEIWNFKEGKAERKKDCTWRKPGFEQTNSHPVVVVSWEDAKKFTDWLSSGDRKQSATKLLSKRKWNAGLPSEALWEYAARAGGKGLYSFGDDEEVLAKYGNAADASFRRETGAAWGIKGDDGFVHTAPVGKFLANDFGLYDMQGNVLQWCEDWYSDYKDVPVGSNPIQTKEQTDQRRVLRGGSWCGDSGRSRAASRYLSAPSNRSFFIGFRVCVYMD